MQAISSESSYHSWRCPKIIFEVSGDDVTADGRLDPTAVHGDEIELVIDGSLVQLGQRKRGRV
jgi:hypothetical protein